MITQGELELWLAEQLQTVNALPPDAAEAILLALVDGDRAQAIDKPYAYVSGHDRAPGLTSKRQSSRCPPWRNQNPTVSVRRLRPDAMESRRSDVKVW